MTQKRKGSITLRAVFAAGSVALAGCALVSTAFAERNPLADRVAADFIARPGAAVWHYAVPAMSEQQRLPDAYPTDGIADGAVKIVAARDEYEPGSFLVWSRQDQGKVRFDLGQFKNEKGDVFPAAELDLKFIKVWYQNRNAWFSYFGDTGFKLCPELMLNDEDLIRVDTKKVANYARLEEKDGKKHELWINPPRQFDVRQLAEGWRQTDTFCCMKPNFHDAATLQPVALPRNEFRNFFLTAHVTKDMKPGVYRGAIAMTRVKDGVKLGDIPVEIKVLDFTLPQPKCYLQPEKDFLVSSYSYISYSLIRERNGWDTALARKQLVAVLRDQVKHNQTMHMVRGGFDNESWETIEAMREAGMRMDVFQGVVFPHGGKYEDMVVNAQRVADELDRRFGHHNVYMGYGDEPGAKWLADNRPVFKAYQSAGLKFFIAGETVFSKAGYIYDWHNSARDAANGEVPMQWNKMQNGTHIAWYANQHVGSENPAFNRRQNGLGAYLSGYTALCNYAHHFGPYNDDTTTYKPMVLAYGSYDGVIDTIAWEGFREGVDDIRYATLLTDLARKAQASKDLELRYQGGLAMALLATAEPTVCDQDEMRVEIIRYINLLKDKVAPYSVKPEPKADVAAAKAAAQRAEANLKKAVDAAIAKVAAAKNNNEKFKAQLAVANTYRAFGRQKEGGEYLVKEGLLSDAIGYFSCYPEKQAELSKKCWETKKANLFSMLPKHPELIKEYVPLTFGNIKPNNTNEWKRQIGWRLRDLSGNHHYMWGDQPAPFLAVYRELVKLATKWGVTIPAGTARNAMLSAVKIGDKKGIVGAADAGLKDPKVSPANRYAFGLAKALIRVGGNPDSFRKAAEAYDKTVTDVPSKDRVSGLCDYGRAVMMAGGENAVRGLNDFRKSLYKPEPKKRYAVQFSDKPITGFSDWDRITAEKSAYDRRYGGNMDFLTTDVTTGERAVGNSKEKLADPTMQVVADVNGIHFLISFDDPKALDVAMGTAGNCSFEGYIAPGANTPYACFMYSPASGHVSVFNTTYNTFRDRPIESESVNRPIRFQSDYKKGLARHYLFFSWKNWMQRVPREGTIWDFENMCWHRSGNSCWNGTETIHGRSTWGELEFHMTDAQRATILKPLLVSALAEYRGEKRCKATRDGVLSHWQDAVMGDPAFYAEKIRPLEQRLDSEAKLLQSDMNDETVFWLEKNTLPYWRDIRFEASRLRTRWLMEH